MGDIADMILDGILDEQTGEFIDDELSAQGGPGYPRTMEKGRYNSIKKKKNTSVPKHGGSHLIGRNIHSQKYGHCVIEDYGGKRGKKKYTVRDSAGVIHKLKLSEFKLN